MSQSSFFAELAEVTKPAPSLRLVIEGVGALLGIGPQPMPTKHRVPPNSRYTPTVTLLAQDPDATLERLVSLDFSIVSNRAADALYGVVRHKSWSAADAAAQGAHLFVRLRDGHERCPAAWSYTRSSKRRPLASQQGEENRVKY